MALFQKHGVQREECSVRGAAAGDGGAGPGAVMQADGSNAGSRKHQKDPHAESVGQTP